MMNDYTLFSATLHFNFKIVIFKLHNMIWEYETQCHVWLISRRPSYFVWSKEVFLFRQVVSSFIREGIYFFPNKLY